MNRLQSDAKRLAVALLAGRFEQEALYERTAPLVTGSTVWLKRLTRQLARQFANKRPRQRELLNFLQHSRIFADATVKDDFGIHFFDRPADFLPSPGLFENTDVVPLSTIAEISEWLGLNESELLWFADRRQLERISSPGPLRHYRYHWKLKRHSKCRLIEAPKHRMRELQRMLLHGIFNHIPVHDAAHGFRKHRSVQTHAAPHVGKAIVLKMDLEDFFPSIPPGRLLRILMHTGYPEDVAEILTSLCCNHVPHDIFTSFPYQDDWKQKRRTQQLYGQPHFPQGAPTSPAVANICAFRLDSRLTGLARSANAVYTRYADDLLFSGDETFARSIDRFKTTVAVIATEENFQVNHHKTRVMTRSVRQEAVGLILNQSLNTRREEFDRLKAILHRCVMQGPEAANAGHHSDFRAHLYGRIQHIAQRNDTRRAKLVQLFEKIVWPSPDLIP